jgi:Glycosyl transferase family 2
VIVAFDSDDQATRELTDKYARSDDRVRCVTADSKRVRGGSRGQSAREAAVQVAHGELVLALDDDVEPEQGLVSGHARRHGSAAADSIVVGYMPVSPLDGSRPAGPARLYTKAYERACSRFLADERSILTGLWGGHFSLPRIRWLEVAKEHSPVGAGYHVDREFGLHLLDAGVRGIFDPDLRAAHRYQRSRAELLQDAQSSGRGLARLYAAYPRLVPAPQEAMNEARGAVRPFVWLSRSQLGWRATTGILLAMSRALAAAHLTSADYALMKLLWRVGFARGVRDARSA